MAGLMNFQKRRAQAEKPASRIEGILSTGTGQRQQPHRAMQGNAHGAGIAKPQSTIPHHLDPALGHRLGQGHGDPAVHRQQLVTADPEARQQGRCIQLQGHQQVVQQHHIDAWHPGISPGAARTHHLLALHDKNLNARLSIVVVIE